MLIQYAQNTLDLPVFNSDCGHGLQLLRCKLSAQRQEVKRLVTITVDYIRSKPHPVGGWMKLFFLSFIQFSSDSLSCNDCSHTWCLTCGDKGSAKNVRNANLPVICSQSSPFKHQIMAQVRSLVSVTRGSSTEVSLCADLITSSRFSPQESVKTAQLLFPFAEWQSSISMPFICRQGCW